MGQLAAETLALRWPNENGCRRLDAPGVLTQNAGMTRQTLLDIENRRPFEPYSLRLNNGDVIQIEQPEHCLVTEDGRTLVFNESGGKLKFVAIANIAMIEAKQT